MDLLVCLWDIAKPIDLAPHKSQRETMQHDLILSKGHSIPALYALASIPDSGAEGNESIPSLRKFGSVFQGHPDTRFLRWLGTCSGSLGQGLSFGCGLAMGSKIAVSSRKTYVVLGDGELQEGQVWEAFLFAAHHALDNLFVVVDRNMLQSDSSTEDVLSLNPLRAKFASFGWNVHVVDGHSTSEIQEALSLGAVELGKPTVVIAHTVKGKGVSFMENQPAWHGSVALTDSDYYRAVQELKELEIH